MTERLAAKTMMQEVIYDAMNDWRRRYDAADDVGDTMCEAIEAALLAAAVMHESCDLKLQTVLADRKAVCDIAEKAIEALRVADLYLDGFVWLEEPEASELEAIKQASKDAQAAWEARADRDH